MLKIQTPLREQQALFASYLNMARHNVFITLSYLNKSLLGIENLELDEDQLYQAGVLNLLSKDKRGKPEEVQKVEDFLMKHFPFVKSFHLREMEYAKKHESNVDPQEKLCCVLQSSLEALSTLRNLYTHSVHKPIEIDDKLIPRLNDCFDVAIRIANDRFSYEEIDLKHLRRKWGKGENGKGGNNKHFEHAFTSEETELSLKGLIFFICLFLEKKYIHLFLDQIKGFKGTSTSKYQSSRAVYCILNMRIPKLRINHESTGLSVATDMLNELKKCPKELFSIISPEDKKKFRVLDEDEQEILMLRNNDRFPYFALQYLEQKKVFTKLGFRINLGNYRHTFYDNKGLDGIPRVRLLQKRMIGYGHLGAMEKKREEEWSELIRRNDSVVKHTAQTKAYITDSHASYDFVKNRVGIKISEEGIFFPNLDDKIEKDPCDCWLSVYELPALIFHNLNSDEKNKKDTEEILIRYVENFRKLYTDIANGEALPFGRGSDYLLDKYGLELKQLTIEFQDYFEGMYLEAESAFEELSEEKIDTMIKDTEFRIDKIAKDTERIKNEKGNQLGKKGFREIKAGRLASFLADDLLYFQPTNDHGRDKLTGMNFQILQSSLAQYPNYKDSIRDILERSQLLKSDHEHPFLQDLVSSMPLSLVSFYNSYLVAKKKYLQKCHRDKDFKNYYFLHPHANKWKKRDLKFYQDKALKFLNQPIELPRGLFEKEIKKLVKHKETDELGIRLDNVSFVIRKQFLRREQDKNQSFYNFPRSYEVFNRLHKLNNKHLKSKPNKDIARYFNREQLIEKTKEMNDPKNKEKKFVFPANSLDRNTKKEDMVQKLRRLYTLFKKNEKTLRQYEVQDMLLFLMVKELLFNHELFRTDPKSKLKEFKLSDISAQGDDEYTNILNERTHFQLKFEDKQNSNGGKPILVTTKSATDDDEGKVRIKDLGKFYKELKDRRIESLFPFVKLKQINIYELKDELERYDANREAVLQLILEFERKVIEKKNLKISPEGNCIGFSLVIDSLTDEEMSTLSKRKVKCIRNAFSHNQYPSVKDCPELLDDLDEIQLTCIANKLKEVLEQELKNANFVG